MDLPPERRALLVRKAQALYRDACYACVEGLAWHHLGRGEGSVVRDLLAWLEAELPTLPEADPEGRREATVALADALRQALAEGE
jgi:hypothetical protein